MLSKPDERQIIALARIHSQGEIGKLIEAEIEVAVNVMVENRDPAVLHEMRGYIKALREFQSATHDAAKTLEKQGRQVPL